MGRHQESSAFRNQPFENTSLKTWKGERLSRNTPPRLERTNVSLQRETPPTGDSTYVLERPARNFLQDAGRIGQGWPFGRPDVFWKNASKTRSGAA